ncbi:MAG: agmatinase [Methanomassiliicoccales archaeon]|nr:agmatinase [Methanomassiliicoccales archaeon]
MNMVLPGIYFADANASFDGAKFIICGVPFDRTTSYRAGARMAPNAIRQASYNFETYLFEHDVDLSDVPINDMGNVEECGSPEEMVDIVGGIVKNIVNAGKFPVFMGGEHTTTIPVVGAFDDIGVISIDAHLDYRESYLGMKYSHACVTRRIAEHLGRENVLVFGVRSISAEEKGDDMPEYVDSFTIREVGVEDSFKRALATMHRKRIFLTLDVDGIDPAFAPATGTPEPFGLTPLEVKKCIGILGERLVGFDVTEVCPPYDEGNTAALAARMMREVIAVAWKNMK